MPKSKKKKKRNRLERPPSPTLSPSVRTSLSSSSKKKAKKRKKLGLLQNPVEKKRRDFKLEQKEGAMNSYDEEVDSGVKIKVLTTTGPERKSTTVAFLKCMRDFERSFRKKSKVIIFSNRPHQARQIQSLVTTQSGKQPVTQKGMHKKRTWKYKGVEWFHKKLSNERQEEIIKNLRSGKAHTVITSDEEADKLLPLAGAIGVAVHFDFPTTRTLHLDRMENCLGSAPLGILESEVDTKKDGQVNRGRISVLLFDEARDSKELLEQIVGKRTSGKSTESAQQFEGPITEAEAIAGALDNANDRRNDDEDDDFDAFDR